jgi:hypothetical protein
MDDAERFVNERERRHLEPRQKVERWMRAPGAAVKRIRLFTKKPDGPEDPYAYVMAPVKPKPPYRRASIGLDRPSF